MTVVDRAKYRLEISENGARLTLSPPRGEPGAILRPLAAFDRTDAPDETLSVETQRAGDGTIEIERRSTVWDRAGVRIVCADDAVELRHWVAGRGDLAEAHVLGGRSLIPGLPTGFMPSGSRFRTLFSPNPDESGCVVQPAGEPAVIGVSGDGEPGRGHWFFTPAPLYLALTTAAVADPTEPPDDGWLGIGLAAPVEELGFVQLGYVPADGGFSLRLDYEGHTGVAGEFTAPSVVITPGVLDPYAGLRAHRDDLAVRGLAPAPQPRNAPAWWSRPMFCGWGAQCHLAAAARRPARDFATQESYDRFLTELAERGLMPGTIVIDDKWQEAYGTCFPDRDKWPDLQQWVAERHTRGQHVLLWWKAWDAEGFPIDLCIRNADGAPVAIDPSNPAAQDAVREVVARMLGADDIGADGLKIDFTARTPSGRALSAHGPGWGIALLHELLSLVYTAAKETKPDALLITHTPHPSFVDVSDMIRLNDMVSMEDSEPLSPVVKQMLHRARIAQSACPELLIDTDDWRVPDRKTWRAYLELKPELGVPSLYYSSHLDATGEPLTDDDFAALRRIWAAARSSQVRR
jgi:hypothetical protein